MALLDLSRPNRPPPPPPPFVGLPTRSIATPTRNPWLFTGYQLDLSRPRPYYPLSIPSYLDRSPAFLYQCKNRWMLFGIYKYGPKLSFPSYQTWIDLTIITRLLLNSLISFSLSRPPTTKLQASTIASSIKYRSSSSSSSSSCLASPVN